MARRWLYTGSYFEGTSSRCRLFGQDRIELDVHYDGQEIESSFLESATEVKELFWLAVLISDSSKCRRLLHGRLLSNCHRTTESEPPRVINDFALLFVEGSPVCSVKVVPSSA